eukprot:snap_masked-scaffold_34-processed-gene-2.10-mRNA-1 protein AED:1.00 eAED:1.00 QI:0/0/0/0/1/1/2/0/481
MGSVKMTNTTTICEFQDLELSSFGLKFFASVSLFFIVTGVFLWTKNRKDAYLRQRGYTTVIFIGTGWIANDLVSSFARGTGALLINCTFHSFLLAVVAPSILYPMALRLYKVTSQLKLYEDLGQVLHPRVANKIDRKRTKADPWFSSPTLDTESQRTPNTSWMDLSEIEGFYGRKFFSSSKFTIVLNIFAALFIFILSFSFAVIQCPEIGAKECTINSEGINSLFAVMLFYIPALLMGIFIFLLCRSLKNYLDPFEIVSELKRTAFLPIILLLIFLVLNTLDPFHINPEFDLEGNILNKEFIFRYELILDLAIAIYGFMTLVVPAYKTQFYSNIVALNKFNSSMTLYDVLRNKTTRAAFARHLTHEFSLENLTFYENVREWREKFDKRSPNHSRITASFVYKTWVKPGSIAEVNLPADVRLDIELNIILGKVSPELFYPAEVVVFDLMATDSFVRFTDSHAFQRFFNQEETMMLPSSLSNY